MRSPTYCGLPVISRASVSRGGAWKKYPSGFAGGSDTTWPAVPQSLSSGLVQTEIYVHVSFPARRSGQGCKWQLLSAVETWRCPISVRHPRRTQLNLAACPLLGVPGPDGAPTKSHQCELSGTTQFCELDGIANNLATLPRSSAGN